MKKVLIYSVLAIGALAFTSCSKDDNKVYVYTVRYESVITNPVDLAIFEYNALGECIATNLMRYCIFGTTRTFNANKMAQKIKIYIMPTNSSSTTYRWVQQVYYLGSSTTIIAINGETMVGTQEP
jgi:hypothetical protein